MTGCARRRCFATLNYCTIQVSWRTSPTDVLASRPIHQIFLLSQNQPDRHTEPMQPSSNVFMLECSTSIFFHFLFIFYFFHLHTMRLLLANTHSRAIRHTATRPRRYTRSLWCWFLPPSLFSLWLCLSPVATYTQSTVHRIKSYRVSHF